MAFFKAVCAKDNKKIELVLQYGSIEDAKEFLRKEGYAILELKETSEIISDTGVFYFDININGTVKTGQINSNDIFKAYVKLVDDLKYEVIYIYELKDQDEREKRLITQKVKNSYSIFKGESIKEEKKHEDKKDEEKKKNETVESEALPDFIRKELNYYYILIDKVLEKIEFIQDNFSNNITEEKKQKLNDIYNKLRQVKNITNVTKLKLIGEIALTKVGELQVELLSKNIMEGKKGILGETNKLLKGFGSSKQIILPEDDIRLKLINLINDGITDLKEFFKSTKKEKIDKNSGQYYNILREKNIYTKKLKEINSELLKNMFDSEAKRRLNLKKKLIKQNIALLTNRIENKKISYTKTIKGFNYYKDIIFFLLQKLSDVIIYSFFVYSIFFVIINILSKAFGQSISINYSFLLYVTIFSFFGFFLKISKNFIILAISSFIYIFLIIFLVINF